ncbi:MAG: protease, partial [Gemmatimonadota bacterium]
MLRKLLGVGLLLCLAAAPTHARAQASGPTRMLRSPTVSATQIAFEYAGDIWIVDRAGGSAHRLTSFPGEETNPHFSPDGSQVAFSAEYGGGTDVYVVPAAGGEPRRLTWHPYPDLAQGWTPDGTSVLFTSGRATWAPSPAPRFFTVPVAGGVPQPMALPRGYQGKISPDGRFIAYRMNNSWDDNRRNYRGGQNRPIWIVDLKTYDLVSPPWKDSKDIDPAWIVLVFEQGFQVHALDPATGRQHVVPITATGDFPWMMPHWADVTARMTNLALSPTGKRALVEARGEIFTIPAEKGDVRDLTSSSGSAERDPAWSPDGKWVSYFSDKSGEYELVIEAQDGLTPPRVIKLDNPKHYYMPSWSPDSKKLVYTDTDLKVWVLDVASGKAKVIGDDPWMVPNRTLNPVWSPDSKWVAYSSRLRSLYHAIFVANVETGETHQVTDGLADAVWPAWDASGKYLWFLASTDFGLRSQWLDMTSYPFQEDFALYVMVLKDGEPSPLLPESDEDQGVGSVPANGGGRSGRGARGARSAGGASGEGATQASSPVTVAIDFDGLAQRTLAVPGVPERPYAKLQAGSDGTVFYMEPPATGGFGAGNALHRYKLSDRKAIEFAKGVGDYALSADGKKLLYRTGGGGGRFGGGRPPSLFIVDANGGPAKAGEGRLDATLTMYLDPVAEFSQIFHEGWRNQRDYLYVPNMHGTDWPRDLKMYGQFLPWVMHRADLNYLRDNMGAEIAIGHSYVRGGDMPE